MSNQTSDILTEEDGDFWKTGSGHAYQQLHVSGTKAHVRRVRDVSFSGKAAIGEGIMKVSHRLLQRAFRIRRVDFHIENVSGSTCWIPATSTVVSLSTPTCCSSAQETGVCCKMSSGTDKDLSQAIFIFFFLIMKDFWNDYCDSNQSFQKVKREKKWIELFCRNKVEGPPIAAGPAYCFLLKGGFLPLLRVGARSRVSVKHLEILMVTDAA